MKTNLQRDETPAISWTMGVAIPLPSLPKKLAELVPPANCDTPERVLPTADAIREQVVASLWPALRGDTIRELALIICCNSHPEALWWVRTGIEQSREIVLKQLTMLLAWRVTSGEGSNT